MCKFGIFVLHSSVYLVLKEFIDTDDFEVYFYDNGFLYVFESYASFVVSKLILEHQGFFLQIIHVW